MPLPVIAVTGGEPAGIGADICLDLAAAKLPCRPVVLADIGLLRQRAAQLGKKASSTTRARAADFSAATPNIWPKKAARPASS